MNVHFKLVTALTEYDRKQSAKRGPIGDKLTKACKAFGEVDPYIGDDQMVYV